MINNIICTRSNALFFVRRRAQQGSFHVVNALAVPHKMDHLCVLSGETIRRGAGDCSRGGSACNNGVANREVRGQRSDRRPPKNTRPEAQYLRRRAMAPTTLTVKISRWEGQTACRTRER